MKNVRKLKNSEKVETVQQFLNDHKSSMGNADAFYDPKSAAYGMADFLAMDFIDKAEGKPIELLEAIALEYAQDHRKDAIIKRQRDEIDQIKQIGGKLSDKRTGGEIDYSRTTNSDHISDALEPIRGMMAILTSMALSADGGNHKYQSQSYDVLYDTCRGVLDKFDELKEQIDYMEDIIRAT